MIRVRLTQLDGSLPNLALMKLSHWHKSLGHDVTFTRQAHRDLFEPEYDAVYGSAIFQFSAPKLAIFLRDWPGAIIGGTGTYRKDTVEELIGAEYERYDYAIAPGFTPSIGFTQRGCRLSCKFCVVPGKEGRPRSVNTIADIWRGPGHPKKLHLLDNDFFGQDEAQWRGRIEEIREGGFKVCLNQGINVRHITPEAAAALATVEYRDDQFTERRIYTAWDNLKDEAVFFRGVDMLAAAGIPAKHIRAYMLVGFDKNETPERMFHRFDRMVAVGIEPFPMVFDCRAKDAALYRRLKQFQRWVVTGLYRAVPWSEYDSNRKLRPAVEAPADLFASAPA
jgi:hypothetical protein